MSIMLQWSSSNATAAPKTSFAYSHYYDATRSIMYTSSFAKMHTNTILHILSFAKMHTNTILHILSFAKMHTNTILHILSLYLMQLGASSFLADITNNEEPKCFKQAAQDARWREAMQKEVKALKKNGTWTLEYLPEEKRAIDSKWVYKIKFKPNGEVEKYKARLVAKGFTQLEGVVSCPFCTVCCSHFIAIAVIWDWGFHQLDVKQRLPAWRP
ncbi:retrovirus-related pol polyprotein from transposon TNT 1-94 [Tanacetum coccineum]